MVSLLISKLGKRIDGMSALAALEELKARRYLSETALSDMDAVRSALEGVERSWPALPKPGEEMWREIQETLYSLGLLSLAGQKAARKYVSRRRGLW